MRMKKKAAGREKKPVMVQYGLWDADAFEQARADTGLTHEKLAEATNMSPSMIQKCAIGERAPSFENLLVIAKVLKVEPAELVTPPGLAFAPASKRKVTPGKPLESLSEDERKALADAAVLEGVEVYQQVQKARGRRRGD